MNTYNIFRVSMLLFGLLQLYAAYNESGFRFFFNLILGILCIAFFVKSLQKEKSEKIDEESN